MDKLGVCNSALGAIGAKRIGSLEERSEQARLCAEQFDLVRDAVLGERPWRFATFRHELAAAGDAPAFGYAYQYPLEAKVIRVLDVDVDDVDDWRQEGRAVLTNTAGPVFIRSVDQVEDVSSWPPGFCQAVATRLASVLAGPLTESRTLVADLRELYRLHLAEAARADAAQGVGGRVFRGNLAGRR